MLAIMPAWFPRSNPEVAAEVFAGFPNTTIIQTPGVAQISVELPECQKAVTIAFFDDPTSEIDTECLTDPAVSTLG